VKTLFPYQNEAKDAVIKAVQQRLPSALIVMATGLGKTVVASSFVEWWDRTQKTQILFLVHLWEAVDQAKVEFAEMLGPEAIFQVLTGKNQLDRNAHVVFSTFQTIRNRYQDMPRNAFGLIIIDECHRSKADTYEPIVEYFRPQFKYAMTATDERMDGRDVRELFGEPVYEYPLAQALANHNLSDVEYRVLVDNISQETLRHIQKLVVEQNRRVTRAMIDRKVFLSERLNVIAQTIKKEQKTRHKTIIFCNSRKHAALVSGYFPDARTYYSGLKKSLLVERLESFKKSATGTLIVVNKLNEAVDIPDADLIVFLRMTESKTVWLQQLGRGLRKKRGKKDVLVLDFVANCDRIRIVGQLASSVKSYLGLSDESSEIHKTGLKFNFETEARDIMEMLKRIETLPRASKDGTFQYRNQTWATIGAFRNMYDLTWKGVKRKVMQANLETIQGHDPVGTVRDFYPLAQLKKAFARELALPHLSEGQTIKLEGEQWGMIHKLAAEYGISVQAILVRSDSIRTKEAISRGKVVALYSVKDFERACSDLIAEIPQAGKDGLFVFKGQKWGNSKSLGKLLGLSSQTILKYVPQSFAMRAKDYGGNLRDFYLLTEARKACAALTKQMPKADDNGVFIYEGEEWATVGGMIKIIGVSERALRTRIKGCVKMKGKSRTNGILDFYKISEVKEVCQDLLQDLPKADKDGFFNYDGEVWASSYALSRMFDINPTSLKVHLASTSCRSMEGKSAIGTITDYFSKKDATKAVKSYKRKIRSK
jgi:superfamily II DNA or RNA helicase